MDKRLFGGMNRGELNIFAGGSGSGKSLFMQNLSLNWILAGLNGIYLSLELSEDLCAMRMDSMLTSIPSKDIFRELDTVEMKVKVISKKAGNLWIKYMPAQSNVNHVRAYIKELQVQHNVKPDFICVDYLDLIMPVSAKVSPNDLFVKDKYVSEELRNLAKELNILLVTASQLNRSAVEEVEFDHSHISGGISKINTADNVFGIFTSRAMKERGRYQLQLMKTRSSSGVGSKIDLEFNLESLRIIDTEQEGDAGYRAPQTQSSGILDQIKNKSTALPAPEAGKINAEVNSSRLKGMLANLRQGNQPN
jgi:archaellum biogenesis ATPase FlaH